jgi:hypothetical protein
VNQKTSFFDLSIDMGLDIFLENRHIWFSSVFQTDHQGVLMRQVEPNG